MNGVFFVDDRQICSLRCRKRYAEPTEPEKVEILVVGLEVEVVPIEAV